MAKYFTCGGWEGDYDHWEPHWGESLYESIDVPDHVARFTGLMDKSGNFIMRASRPIGFGTNLDG